MEAFLWVLFYLIGVALVWISAYIENKKYDDWIYKHSVEELLIFGWFSWIGVLAIILMMIWNKWLKTPFETFEQWWLK